MKSKKILMIDQIMIDRGFLFPVVEVRRMAETMNMTQIAKELGVSFKVAGYFCKKYKITPVVGLSDTGFDAMMAQIKKTKRVDCEPKYFCHQCGNDKPPDLFGKSGICLMCEKHRRQARA